MLFHSNIFITQHHLQRCFQYSIIHYIIPHSCLGKVLRSDQKIELVLSALERSSQVSGVFDPCYGGSVTTFREYFGKMKTIFFAKCGNVPSTNGRPFVRISIIVIFIINTWINEAFVWACVHSIKMCNDNVKEDILLEIRNCRVNRLYYVFIFLEVIQ